MPAPRRMVRRTARRTGRRMYRRQQAMNAASQAASQEPAASAPPPEAQASVDPQEQLKKLGELHEQGVLTDEEFAAAKARLVGRDA